MSIQHYHVLINRIPRTRHVQSPAYINLQYIHYLFRTIVVAYALPKGLKYGLMKMKPGEIARINVPPNYGYGTSTLYDYGIPPNTHLVFEVELISAENVS